MRKSRRRRRRRPRESRLAQEAFDLFLDALANTLGVIMFIALMIVLFAAPPEEPERPAEDARQTAQALAASLERITALERELVSLPPAGDPAIVEAWRRLRAEIDALHARLTEMLRRTAVAVEARNAAIQESADAVERTRETDQKLADVERRIDAVSRATPFVRVSRFREDPRTPILVLVNDGRAMRVEPAAGATEIQAPQGVGPAIDSADAAESAADALLAGLRPGSHRLEIGVWQGSFAAFKRLERALVDRGFDLNAIPVRRGEPLRAGVGGIQ